LVIQKSNNFFFNSSIKGEDRWLCTLLLQEGYRVEYCAASDALTYAPESFHVNAHCLD